LSASHRGISRNISIYWRGVRKVDIFSTLGLGSIAVASCGAPRDAQLCVSTSCQCAGEAFSSYFSDRKAAPSVQRESQNSRLECRRQVFKTSLQDQSSRPVFKLTSLKGTVTVASGPQSCHLCPAMIWPARPGTLPQIHNRDRRPGGHNHQA